MKKLRDILGYVLGGLLFVLLIPAVMWFASGRPAIAHVSVLRTSVAVLMMLGGLAMSVWTIVYAPTWQGQSYGCFRTRSCPTHPTSDD